MTDSRLLTAAELATSLGVTESWVRGHTNTLPHVQVGKYVRFDPSKVIAHLSVGPAPAAGDYRPHRPARPLKFLTPRPSDGR